MLFIRCSLNSKARSHNEVLHHSVFWPQGVLDKLLCLCVGPGASGFCFGMKHPSPKYALYMVQSVLWFDCVSLATHMCNKEGALYAEEFHGAREFDFVLAEVPILDRTGRGDQMSSLRAADYFVIAICARAWQVLFRGCYLIYWAVVLLPMLVEMFTLPPFIDYNGANGLLKLARSKTPAAPAAALDGAPGTAQQESDVAPPSPPLVINVTD